MVGRDRTRERLRQELADLGIAAPERASAGELLALLDAARAERGLPPARRSGLVGAIRPVPAADRPASAPVRPQEPAAAPARTDALPPQSEPPEARASAPASWQPLGSSTAAYVVQHADFTRYRPSRPSHVPPDGPGACRDDLTVLGQPPRRGGWAW